MRATPQRILLALVPLLAAGCAANLATLQTAETLEPKQVRVSAGMGVYVPAGQLAGAAGAAARQTERLVAAQEGESPLPDRAEQREILETALSLALYPPGMVDELGFRIGLLDGLDAGLRWSTGAWRLDAKLRLYDGGDPDPEHPHRRGPKLALLLGAEIHPLDGLLFDLYGYLQEVSGLFQFVELESPSRWDLEPALLLSWNFGDAFLPYFALKYRAGFYHIPSILSVEVNGVPQVLSDQDIDGVVHYIMGTAGAGLGYRWVHLLLELNVGTAISRPKILGEPADLGGLTVYPTAAIALQFP